GRVHLGTFQPNSQLAHQGSVHVLFHGELDNEAALRADLARDRIAVVGPGAAPVLRALYERDKSDLGRILRGAFCAVVLDEVDGTVHLITDRLGSYPLYWFHTSDRLVFASELRAALRDH